MNLALFSKALADDGSVFPFVQRQLSSLYSSLGDGTLRIDLDAGDEVIVVTKGTRTDLTVAPVTTNGTGHVWGLPEIA